MAYTLENANMCKTLPLCNAFDHLYKAVAISLFICKGKGHVEGGKIKNEVVGAEERTHCSCRGPGELPFPDGGSQPPLTPVPGAPNALFWPLQAPAHTQCTYKHAHIHIKINKETNKPCQSA